MTIKTIAPGRKLRADAANSYKRARAAGMPAGGLNSAYRSLASQEALFLARYRVQWTGRGKYNDARWYKGKRYVRVSSAGMVAVPGKSKHTTGVALDVSTSSAAHRWLLSHGARFGWRRTISAEPWHWEYDAKRDADAVIPIQRAVRVGADGIWKTVTDKATWAVRAASNYRGGKFPYGVAFTQARVGTKVDKRWGPNSAHDHDATAKDLQRALARLDQYNGRIDGIWAKKSDTGFLAARKLYKR